MMNIDDNDNADGDEDDECWWNDSVDGDDDELWMLVVFCLSFYNFLSHLASLPVIAP